MLVDIDVELLMAVAADGGSLHVEQTDPGESGRAQLRGERGGGGGQQQQGAGAGGGAGDQTPRLQQGEQVNNQYSQVAKRLQLH